MNYKIIAMDMDDTLLQDDHTISKKTKDKLIEAQSKGVILVLASGRPNMAMNTYAKELKMEENGGYILGFNGGILIECKTGNVVYSQNISKEMAHMVYDYSREYGTNFLSYIDGKIVTDNITEYVEVEQTITQMDVEVCEDIKSRIDKDVVKVMLLANPEHLKEVEKKLIPLIKNDMTMVISKPFFLEFIHPKVDKGATLTRLANILNVDIKEVIAVGDSYNDMTMIKASGLGVAMGNANEDIKKIANYITDDNMNDGIATMLEKFVL